MVDGLPSSAGEPETEVPARTTAADLPLQALHDPIVRRSPIQKPNRVDHATPPGTIPAWSTKAQAPQNSSAASDPAGTHEGRQGASRAAFAPGGRPARGAAAIRGERPGLHVDPEEADVGHVAHGGDATARAGRGAAWHGFRSTFRDWAAERTAYPHDLAALAHALEIKVEAAYRRGDVLAKRIAMMQDWADYCLPPPPRNL